MDVTAAHLPITSNQLRHLAPGLRLATAKDLRFRDPSPNDQWSFLKHNRAAQLRLNAKISNVNRQRKVAQKVWSRILDGEDGAELARSSCPLPSDLCRNKPRLERQEALRAPKTVRFASDVVECDADLYRLGLLYDDEHMRGSGFGLDSIVHSDPIYPVRPANRARESRNYNKFHEHELLELELSFSSLGSDENIEHFLAPETHELYPEDEATERSRIDGDLVPELTETPLTQTPVTRLHVIYEHLEDTIHSLKRPSPTAINYPDLNFDSEGEEGNETWEVVPRGVERDGLRIFDVEAAEDGAASATEPWIVLGET